MTPSSGNVTLKHPRLSRQASKPSARQRGWWCQGAARSNLCKLHNIYMYMKHLSHNMQMYHVHQFGTLSSVSLWLDLPPVEAPRQAPISARLMIISVLRAMRFWKRNAPWAREAQPGRREFTQIRFWQEALSLLHCAVVHYAKSEHILQCILKQVRHTQYIFLWFEHLGVCALCSVQCAVCGVQCSVCSVQCAVCSV